MIERLLIACALWLMPVTGWAAPVHVQSANGQAFSGTTVQAVFASNVTAGNLIVVCLYANKGLTSLADTRAHTYSTATANTDGSTYAFGAYYVANISGGANTVTATLTAAHTFALLSVHEYSGVITTSPLDQATFNFQATPGTGTNAITSGNVTTTTDGQLIFGCAGSTEANTGVVSAGTNYTIRQNPLNDNPSEDRVQASAGSTAATFTTNDTTASYHSLIATFKAGASAGVTPRRRMLMGVGP